MGGGGLARSQARLGLIPATHALVITKVAEAGDLDVVALARAARAAQHGYHSLQTRKARS